jgi:hypothetical protein
VIAMRAHGRFTLFALTLAVAFAPGFKSAKADRLLITTLGTGAVLFDETTPQPGEGERALTYVTAVPVYGGGVERHAVILTAPPGAPPGENPIFVPGTSLIALDLVEFVIERPDVCCPWIFDLFLIPDGAPGFESILVGEAPHASLVEATGGLQDLTSLLQSDKAGWRVQVQSEVIPEPGAGLLVAMGLLGLAYRQRRQRRAAKGTRP